jgi:hypothetical protein
VKTLFSVLRQSLDHIPHLEKTNPQLRDTIALLKGQMPKPS